MKKCDMKNGMLAIVTLFLVTVSFISCDKNDDDDNINSGNASTTFKVTDAAIDDASVTGAFVTIADIKLDGQSVQGFTKTTIDINAYRNGATSTIGTFNLSGRTYSSITFVLDYDMDASGASPGSYVVTTGGVKHKLQSDASAITVSKNFTLTGNASNSIVADFDLRKMIIHTAGADHYNFATSAELSNSIRVVSENGAGTISGTLTNTVSGSAKVVAYAYKKGTFNRATEMQGQGSSNVQFRNAVTSAVVSGSGAYQLNFLENGNYEVHFAHYTDTDVNGELELSGTLVVTSALDLLNLLVSANTTLTVNATATAVLP